MNGTTPYTHDYQPVCALTFLTDTYLTLIYTALIDYRVLSSGDRGSWSI